MYEAKITVFGDPAKLIKCFGSELDKIKTDRSTIKVIKGKNNINFAITATDSVALRAILSNITKICTVYEQIKKIK